MDRPGLRHRRERLDRPGHGPRTPCQLLGWTDIGAGNRFSPFSSIGTEPQDVGYKGDETHVRIGDRNIFREFVTVHRGTVKGGGLTRIGDDSYFMAYAHIAHDCRVGNQVIMINAATLGGHVEVGDGAMSGPSAPSTSSAGSAGAPSSAGSRSSPRTSVPYCKVAGQRPVHILGPNAIGLRRKGFSSERIRRIKSIFDDPLLLRPQHPAGGRPDPSRVHRRRGPGRDPHVHRGLETGHHQEVAGSMGDRLGVIAGSGPFARQALALARAQGYDLRRRRRPGRSLTGPRSRGRPFRLDRAGTSSTSSSPSSRTEGSRRSFSSERSIPPPWPGGWGRWIRLVRPLARIARHDPDGCSWSP